MDVIFKTPQGLHRRRRADMNWASRGRGDKDTAVVGRRETRHFAACTSTRRSWTPPPVNGALFPRALEVMKKQVRLRRTAWHRFEPPVPGRTRAPSFCARLDDHRPSSFTRSSSEIAVKKTIFSYSPAMSAVSRHFTGTQTACEETRRRWTTVPLKQARGGSASYSAEVAALGLLFADDF